MTSNPDALREFASREFVDQVWQLDRDAFVSDPSAFRYGQWLESQFWLHLGADVGYFSRETALATSAILRAYDISSLPVTWSRWFQGERYFGFSPEGKLLFYEPRPERELQAPWWSSAPFDPAVTLGIFQAALIASLEFRSSCCLRLQEALQSGDPMPISQKFVERDVLRAYAQENPIPEVNTAVLLAGYIKMLDLMSVIESIFPPALKPDGRPRSVLARILGHLWSWRLNLRNELVRRNLASVEAVFWDHCGQWLMESGISGWTSNESRERIDMLYRNWRDRADPDLKFRELLAAIPHSVSDRGAENLDGAAS